MASLFCPLMPAHIMYDVSNNCVLCELKRSIYIQCVFTCASYDRHCIVLCFVCKAMDTGAVISCHI